MAARAKLCLFFVNIGEQTDLTGGFVPTHPEALRAFPEGGKGGQPNAEYHSFNVRGCFHADRVQQVSQALCLKQFRKVLNGRTICWC